MIKCKDEICGYNTKGECRFPELPDDCWRTGKVGDITLRFHASRNEFEIIFEDSKHKLHSLFNKKLDDAICDIITLLKMMS